MPMTDLGAIFTPPPDPNAPPEPPDTRPGFVSGVLGGLGAAGREAKQLAAGDAFTATEPPPPQPERTLMGRVGYGVAHSAPTLGGMALGTYLGAAAGTPAGPWGTTLGGLGGGALGGSLTDFAQSLIPAYEDALRQGLDHDAAVNQAYHVAEASGAFTGLTAPLFGLRAVKSMVGNLLFHAAVTGPGTGAVKQGVIDPAITGQPTPSADEMLQGAIENAIGGGVAGGVMHYGQHFGGQLATRLRGGATTSGDGSGTAPPPSGPGTPLTAPATEPPPIPSRPTPFTDLVRPPPEGVAPGEAVPITTPTPEPPPIPPRETPPDAITAQPRPGEPTAAPVIPEPPAAVPPGEPAGTETARPGMEPPARPTGTIPVDETRPGQPPEPGVAPGVVRPEPALVAPEPPTPGVEPGTEPGAHQPGAPLANGFFTGPEPGDRFRVGPTASVNGALLLEKRSGGGSVSSFFLGKDGNLIDADTVRLNDAASRDRLWTPETPEHAAAATAILQEMGALPLTAPRRLELRARLRRLVTGEEPPGTAPVPGQAEPVPGQAEPRGTIAKPIPITPEPTPSPESTPPAHETPGTPAYKLGELDRANAPDEAYRDALSTGSKDPLKPGETWRDRLVKWVDQERAAATAGEPETSAQGANAPGTVPAPPAAAETPTPVAAPQATETPRPGDYTYTPMNVDEPTTDKVFYHGTKAPIAKLADADIYSFSNTGNLYGHGLYLTDHPEVARSYSEVKGRGPPGKVFAARLHDLKLLDLDRPAHPDLVAAFRDAAGDYLPEHLDEGLTGKDLFEAVKENMRDDGLTRDEASEVLYGVAHNLDERGYDGFRHEGGGIRGREHGKHNVAILFEAGASVDGREVGKPVGSKFTEIKHPGARLADQEPPGTLESRASGPVFKPVPKDWRFDAEPATPDGYSTLTLKDAAGAVQYKAQILEDSPGVFGLGQVENISRSQRGIGPAFYRDIADHVNALGGKLYVGIDATPPAQNVHVTLDKAGALRKVSPEEVIRDQSRSADAAGMSAKEVRAEIADRNIYEVLPREPRLTDQEAPGTLESRAGFRRKAPAPGEPPPLPPRTHAPTRKDPVVTPQVGDPLTFKDYAYSEGTPAYRDAFHDALRGTGTDPNTMTNRPIAEQVKVLGDALKTKYGFDKVEIDPGVEHKTTRDQLLNMHHNMQNMAHALGWSQETIALNGRLGLHLVPYNFKGENWFGSYSFADKTIHISGGSNSYAHEHWHAIDDYMTDLLHANPNKKALLSWNARDGALDPSDPVQSAFARVLNAMSYNRGEEMLRRLKLEQTAQKVTKAGQPTKSALAARAEIENLDKGASRLRIPPSDLRTAALKGPNPQYWASIHELFARVGEAFTAHKMEQMHLDPSGVVTPDKGYQDRMLAEVLHRYPDAGDRREMFKAFADLVTELDHASVLNRGLPPAERTSEAHTLKPWSQRPPDIRPGMMTAIREDLKSLRWANLFGKNAGHEPLFHDPDAPAAPLDYSGFGKTRGLVSPVMRPIVGKEAGPFSGTGESARRIWYSALGNLEDIRDRAPPAARKYIQRIRDRIGTDPESGRLIGQTYAERVRYDEQRGVAQFADIFRDNGIVQKVTRRPQLTNLQDAMVRHVLTTGETSYPRDAHDLTGAGPRTQIPPELVKVAHEIRGKTLDPLYDRMKAAGMDIGYAKSGYFPRSYNDRNILSNKDEFIHDRARLNRFIFDKDLGAMPDDAAKAGRLHKWWTETPDAVRRSGLFPNDTRTAMAQLGRNLRRIGEIDRELAAGPGGPGVNPTTHDPIALGAEREGLRVENANIHDQHMEAVRDPLAHHEANNVFNQIADGNPLRFTTLGPDSQFTRGRVLPPETDQIMRRWMHTKVLDTIPHYIGGVSRKAAYQEMFGKNGEANAQDISDARANGMHGSYSDQIHMIIEAVTGRSARTTDAGMTQAASLISTLGQTMLLPGAALSATAEPFGSVLAAPRVGLGFKTMFGTYARMGSAMFGKGDAAERMATLRFIGGVKDSLQGAAAATRFSDYAGTPGLQRYNNAFFETTGLSPAIRWIRSATLGTFPMYTKTLLKWATEPATGAKALARQDDARIALRDLFISNEQMPAMRDFVNQFPDLPTRDALENHDMGPLWQLAANRFLDRFNQDPTAAQKPLGGLRSPTMNMVQGLTSYPWTFWRNIMEPALHRAARANQREWDRRTAAGEDGAGREFQAAAARFQNYVATAAGAAALLAGTGLMWIPRQYLFNNSLWQKHEDAGDVEDWLLNGAISASGLAGPLDMFNQMLTSLRYTTDLSNAVEGPYLGTIMRNAIDVVRGIGHVVTGTATGSNVEVYNAILGLEQLVVKPGMLAGLTYIANRVPAGGMLAGLLTTMAVTATSQTAMRSLADAAAGPKGATVKPPPKDGEEDDAEDKPEPDPPTDLEEADAARAKTKTGSGEGATSLLVGLSDDILPPLMKLVPGRAKAAIAALMAAGGVGGLLYQGHQYKTQGEPPAKAH
jgi:hypothetical protein